ncbi:hypothetical protein [Micromonospora haikouensis]|uniref:hypothetical protein n=1 Tax=Micromonospora haikouensis TaxID=686309 RepID=UPI003D94B4D5
MGDAERRRRRSRHHTDGEALAATAGTQDVAAEPPRRRPTPGGDDRDGGERGLRGLVGPGSSQVGPRAAMRARDAARPTEADLAEAEERVVVVRRNWVPREDLPRSGR